MKPVLVGHHVCAPSEDTWNGADVRNLIYSALTLAMVVFCFVSLVQTILRRETVEAPVRDRVKSWAICSGLGLLLVVGGAFFVWDGLSEPMEMTPGPFAACGHGWSTGIFGAGVALLGLWFSLVPFGGEIARWRAKHKPRRRRSRRLVPGGKP